jgi:hypothetical protein
MKQFLTPYFWFSLRGDLSVVSRYGLIALVLLLAVALVYIKFTRGDWKRTLYRMTYENAFSFSLVNFLIGLYLWFVTDQVVPVLSARIWFLFWFIEMIVWAYFIHKDYQKVPDRRRELEDKKDIKKYIP